VLAAASTLGAAVEALSTTVVPAIGSGLASLSPATLERNSMLALLLQGLATSSSSTLGANTAVAQLVGALVGSEMPAPETLAASMRTFVAALKTMGLEGSADGTKTHATGEETPLPDAVRAAVNALRERARSLAGEPSHGAAATLAEEHIRGVSAQVARELGAEQQRVAAQWLAEGRAELAIPVDIPGGTGWVRLRVRRRATPAAGADPQGEAALALLVELPALGLVHVAAALSAGRLQASIDTSSEASATWLCERRPELEAALGAAGLRVWSVDIRADPALVAREGAPWPLPTLEEGSLVDARA
jgi:hypothetical protein